jgi:hypothetical protein
MITHDVIYSSRQRFEDMIAEANPRPYEGVTVRYNVLSRAVEAVKAAFAKHQPAQKPALREDYATH